MGAPRARTDPDAVTSGTRLAADGHWDLLLTDLDMLGMTGLELLAALRQLAPALPGGGGDGARSGRGHSRAAQSRR